VFLQKQEKNLKNRKWFGEKEKITMMKKQMEKKDF
jgi:hypothetical protein